MIDRSTMIELQLADCYVGIISFLLASRLFSSLEVARRLYMHCSAKTAVRLKKSCVRYSALHYEGKKTRFVVFELLMRGFWLRSLGAVQERRKTLETKIIPVETGSPLSDP
jgi:hypothetical protein